jgi:glycosyltransferase involved in cell wall biosynthesis
VFERGDGAEECIEFVFIGGGRSIPFLKENVKSRSLSNVKFIGYQPLENLSSSLSAGDISIVSERSAVAGLLLPSKTYAMLAAGRPVVFIGSERSDAASIVRTSGAGDTIAPNDVSALISLILRLRDDPREAAAMGKRARSLAEQVYSRRLSTKRWAAVMNSLLERSEAPSLSQPAFPP